MSEVVIQGRLCIVPSPLYIDPHSVVIDGNRLRAKCRFPSSDPSVGDRGDHANIAHALFALWNCSNILIAHKGWRKCLALKSTQVAYRAMPPDVDIDILFEITEASRVGDRVVGSAKGALSLTGKRLLDVVIEKFTERI